MLAGDATEATILARAEGQFVGDSPRGESGEHAAEHALDVFAGVAS